MELRQLEIFCAAAKALNFTKAGQKLGYAQSNITGQIRRIEEELNVKLFERIGRKLQLTSEGKRFLENAETILALYQKAKQDFLPEGIRGVLNIGAAETACVYRLPQILTHFHQLYPQVEIRVQTENCEHFYQMIKTGQIDAAFVLTDQIAVSELIAEPLYEERMILVAAPGHPLAGKPNVKLTELTGDCLITTLPGCGYRPLVLSLLRNSEVKPGSLMELSSIAAIKQCTSCGLGISVLPLVAVQEDLVQGKLVQLAWDDPDLNVKTQLVYHRDKWLSPALNAFLSVCRDRGGCA